MAKVRCKTCVIVSFLFSASTLAYLACYTATFTQLRVTTKQKMGFHMEWSSVPTPNVVVPASFDSRNETFGCRTMRLMNMAFPVCHYTFEDDDTVTRFLLRGQYFEASEVSCFLQLLRRDPKLQLVDIGANVGLYSLPAARVTQVLAVEPNWRSMARLAKAVDLGAVASNITLVHNAVSNVRTTLNMGVHPRNQGTAFLINSTKCKVTPNNKPCNTLSMTDTILLNDLLPLMRTKAALMKVDVEGHEVNIFTHPTAGKFFENIDVPLIFMEWVLCRRHPADIVQRLIDFFHSRNYTAFTEGNSKLESHYLKWPENILWKKTRIHF